MKKEKIWALILATVLLVAGSISVKADENKNVISAELQETINNLKMGYSEYYNINSTDITLCWSQELDGLIENTYLLEMNVVLKANSVDELDYYQGVTECSDTIAATISKVRTEDNRLRMENLFSKQLEIYDELQTYIGKVQNFNFYIKETYPINNAEEKEILFENGDEFTSWEKMIPASHYELKTNGFQRMASMDESYLHIKEDLILQPRGITYSVNNATNYMQRYTSNPTECNICGTSCGMKVDTTKYNPAYSCEVAVGKHKDCANYVSQALLVGGIPSDGTWKPGSIAWVNVSALTNYMTSKNYWGNISYTQVQKGDILSSTVDSHVIMITSYDGTTYTYCGHTNDKLNVAIRINSSSTYKYYRVITTG